MARDWKIKQHAAGFSIFKRIPLFDFQSNDENIPISRPTGDIQQERYTCSAASGLVLFLPTYSDGFIHVLIRCCDRPVLQDWYTVRFMLT